MLRILSLVLFTLTFIAAADAEASKLPADADKAYRAYQATLAKAYNAETTKVQKALKAQEASLRKKDPAAADEVKALLDRIDKAGALSDLSTLVTGGVIDDTRIGGGVEALIGTWDYSFPNGIYPEGNFQRYTFKADGTAVYTFKSGGSTGNTAYRWKATAEAVSINLVPIGATGAYSTSIITIKLPLPTSGPVTASLYQKSSGVESTSVVTFTRYTGPEKK